MNKQFEIAYADLPEDQRVRKIAIPAEEAGERYRPAYRAQVASYQVRHGDTIASLARRYKVSAKEIARLNRMSARGELRKGQTVRIPQTVSVARDRRGRVISTRGHQSRHRTERVLSSRQRGRERGRSVSSRPRSAKEHSSKGHSSRHRR